MLEVNAVVLWIFAGVQAAGLLSAWSIRLSQGSAGERPCQCLFLLCMAMVGTATVVALAAQSRGWILCGSTLTAMVLGAIWDFSHTHRAETVRATP